MNESKKTNEAINEINIDALRQKLAEQEAAVKRSIDRKIENLDTDETLKNLPTDSIKVTTDSSWDQLLNRISSAAGSAGNAVTSSVKLLPIIPYQKHLDKESSIDKVEKTADLTSGVHIKSDKTSDLTDTECLELTKKLIQDFNEPVKNSHKDTPPCLGL